MSDNISEHWSETLTRERDEALAQNAVLRKERDELVKALNGFVEKCEYYSRMNFGAVPDYITDVMVNDGRTLLTRIKEAK